MLIINLKVYFLCSIKPGIMTLLSPYPWLETLEKSIFEVSAITIPLQIRQNSLPPFSLSGHFGRKKTVPDNSNISLTYKANLSILPAIKGNFLSNIKYTSEKEDSTYEI